MSQDLQLLGRAKRTHDGYLREVRKLACYFNQSPDQLTQQQVADRLLPFPGSTLQVLRTYWKQHRNDKLLFPANGRNRKSAANATTPMGASSVQGCVKRAVKHLGINKSVSPHTLRHSIATHLFEAGASLIWIQKFLGHSNLQTTLVYLHLTDDGEENARQVLNTIADPTSAEKLFRRFQCPGQDRSGN